MTETNIHELIDLAKYIAGGIGIICILWIISR